MARAFDGTGDYLSHSSIPDLGDFTLCMLMRTTTTEGGGSEALCGVFEDGDNEAIQMQLNTDNNGNTVADKLWSFVRFDPNAQVGMEVDDASIFDGTWRHHVLKRNDGVLKHFFGWRRVYRILFMTFSAPRL